MESKQDLLIWSHLHPTGQQLPPNAKWGMSSNGRSHFLSFSRRSDALFNLEAMRGGMCANYTGKKRTLVLSRLLSFTFIIFFSP